MYLITYSKHNGMFYNNYTKELDDLSEVKDFIELEHVRNIKIYKANEIKIKLVIDEVEND